MTPARPRRAGSAAGPRVGIAVAWLCAWAASGCATAPRDPEPPFDLTAFWTSYYQNPRPEEVGRSLELVDADDLADPKRAFGAVVGFMSELFRTNPERREAWLTERAYSWNTQAALVYALWLGGSKDAARAAMARYQWPREAIATVEASMGRVETLDVLVPSDGNQLDMFWGAFFASGDEKHVTRILEAYTSRARDPAIAPRDIQLLVRLPPMRTPESADPVDLQQREQLRARHSHESFDDVVIAAAALWALSSNADRHDRVREVVLRHLRGAPDDAATRALAEQLALSSRQAFGSQDEPVLFFTTGDPEFVKEFNRAVAEGRAPRKKVDKVFRNGERALGALIVAMPSDEHVEVRIETVSLEGEVARVSSRVQGMQYALVRLPPEGDATGLLEVHVTVSYPTRPVIVYRTFIYLDDGN